MSKTLEYLQKIYPVGTKVAYDRGVGKPDLGVIIEHVDDPNLGSIMYIENWEFPEYSRDYVIYGRDKFKAYYNQRAVDKDRKNIYYL